MHHDDTTPLVIYLERSQPNCAKQFIMNSSRHLEPGTYIKSDESIVRTDRYNLLDPYKFTKTA